MLKYLNSKEPIIELLFDNLNFKIYRNGRVDVLEGGVLVDSRKHRTLINSRVALLLEEAAQSASSNCNAAKGAPAGLTSEPLGALENSQL